MDWAFTALVTQDINHDGVVEIITGDAMGSVACFTGDGDPVWTYAGTHGFTRCPAVGDLDGDGYPEILVGGTTMPLICLSHEGEELWRVEREARGSSPGHLGSERRRQTGGAGRHRRNLRGGEPRGEDPLDR